MATTGNFTIQGNVSGAPTGQRTLGPFTIPITAGVDQTSVIALSTGANTVTVPSGTTFMAVLGPNATSPQPNPAFGGTLTIKGVSGDTGIAVSAKYYTVFTWDSTTAAPANFVINASAPTTVEVFFA